MVFSKIKRKMERKLTPQDLKCHHCGETFTRKFGLNRHLQNKHNEQPVMVAPRVYHIVCIICSNNQITQSFAKYNKYISHLIKLHNIKIEEEYFTFQNVKEFEEWRVLDKKDVDFSFQSNSITQSSKTNYYNCNRSNTKGYQSKCSKKVMKSGGSIKINGTCPSRIIATFLENGPIMVRYIRTHVGHETEPRAQRLSKTDQNYLLDQLKAGVNMEEILEKAKAIKNGNGLGRMNILTRKDLRNLRRRHNLDPMRHSNDMIAITEKVKQLNSGGKNYVFLFKQFGEDHPILKSGDFALAFMNDVMEKKLKDFPTIVCIDEIHGLANFKNWNLTVVLIEDEVKDEFPVAFMISNRKDQIIQEVFLTTLRAKIGANILAEYLITADDKKYYNAWIKVMNNNPKWLLCTWHVLKHWNIQGKRRIKNGKIKRSRKRELRNIVEADSIDKFNEYKDIYLKKLQDSDEQDFLEYLNKYYFCTKERIMSWARCYRIGVGIHRNMVLQTLNGYIKEDKLQNKGNIRMEKLLNLLEKVVEEKMWKAPVLIKKENLISPTRLIAPKIQKELENGQQYIDNRYVETILTSTETNVSENLIVYIPALDETQIGGEISELFAEEVQVVEEMCKSQIDKTAMMERYANFMNDMCSLDDNSFIVFAKNFELLMDKTYKDLNIVSEKRKFEEQPHCLEIKKKK